MKSLNPKKSPNLLFLLVDQLSAAVLNLYGYEGVPTPNIDALAKRGITFENMISSCPVCTPFRSMWLTGRYPQTTGHVINTMTTRHDEIGWGDVFNHAGYDTGYIGKWHLHKGVFPDSERSDFYIPEGRNRLGFRWWRAYNLMASFFDGEYNLGDTGRCAKWEGYEPDALTRMTFEFLDEGRDKNKPFCLMVSPHQPHLGEGHKPGYMAPEEFYDRLPEETPRPAEIDPEIFEKYEKDYRHYYAMILSIDDMVGEIVSGLEERGLLDSTILVFSSDHGTHMGMHPCENTNPFWTKKKPYDTSVRIPLIVSWPEMLEKDVRNENLISPVDLLPSFCGLCGLQIPKSVEGENLSGGWLSEPKGKERDAVYMMNFAYRFSHPRDGWEWRGLRTKRNTFARFLSGEVVMFDNIKDPFQQNNLAHSPQYDALFNQLDRKLSEMMKERNDDLHRGSYYANWFDEERRVIRNSSGPLGDPEAQPDWTLLS